jgi:hypothetical protein
MRLPLAACLVLLGACERTPLVGTGVTPVAAISPGRVEVARGVPVSLSGADSFDPAGEALRFAWRLVTRPAGTRAQLTGGGTARVELTPDGEGAWELELVVFAGERRSLPATAIVSVRPPGVDAGTPDAGADGGLSVDAGAATDAGPRFDGGLRVLDPGDVYLAGTLSEGACYRSALAHWANPNVAAVAFDCYFNAQQAVIRPTDGRLLYVNTFEDLLREFHCDACPYAGTYPSWSLVPDVVVPTPCPVGGGRLGRFRVSADGTVLHACTSTNGLWRDARGDPVYDGTIDELVVVGAGGWLLTRTRVVSLDGGASASLAGLPPSPAGAGPAAWLSARWSGPGGFLVAAATAPVPSLWRVDLQGAAQRVGDYPPLPAGFDSRDHTARLDSAGRLFTQGDDTSGTFIDVIIRREVGGTADVVYTERSNPLVKLHGSALVTGP